MGFELWLDVIGQPFVGPLHHRHLAGFGGRETGLAFGYGVVATPHIGERLQGKLAGLGDTDVGIVADGHPALAAVDVALGGEDLGSAWRDADCKSGLPSIEDEAV